MSAPFHESSEAVELRNIEPADFDAITAFEYSVSIIDPHNSVSKLQSIYDETGFWTDWLQEQASSNGPSSASA